jgi:hypothetical protein
MKNEPCVHSVHVWGKAKKAAQYMMSVSMGMLECSSYSAVRFIFTAINRLVSRCLAYNFLLILPLLGNLHAGFYHF